MLGFPTPSWVPISLLTERGGGTQCSPKGFSHPSTLAHEPTRPTGKEGGTSGPDFCEEEQRMGLLLRPHRLLLMGPTGVAWALLVPVQSLSQQTLPVHQAPCWVLAHSSEQDSHVLCLLSKCPPHPTPRLCVSEGRRRTCMFVECLLCARCSASRASELCGPRKA